MNIIFETSRLYHRQFQDGDAIHFFNLNNDTDVIKYTGDKPFTDLTEAQLFLKNYKYIHTPSNPEIPIGRWAMIRKTDDAFIGWCGLKYEDKFGEIDLGYRLFKKFWGQNFATESAIACLNFGFEVLKINEIVGRAMHENKASIRVLEKCGMIYRNEFVADDYSGKCFVKNILSAYRE